MKKHHLLYSLVVFAFLLAMLPAAARGEEELAPGFNACIGKAVSTVDQVDCLSTAYKYWDKQLNANYQKAKAQCANAEKPDLCRQHLLKAERAWVAYKEAMGDVVWDMNGGGSISRVSAIGFSAEETKKQAELLKSFIQE